MRKNPEGRPRNAKQPHNTSQRIRTPKTQGVVQTGLEFTEQK